VLDAPISLESEPAKGTTFSVTLPKAEAQARPPRHDQDLYFAGSITGCLVLCVENEAKVLAGMEALLNGWGCRVLLAESREQALEIARVATEPPHIILADYHLDDGTGVETVAAVRAAIGVKIPAVIISADHSVEVQRDIRRRGFMHLRKPLKAAALRAILMQSMLRRAAAE
jgi:CheY-like chemotaxis protein